MKSWVERLGEKIMDLTNNSSYVKVEITSTRKGNVYFTCYQEDGTMYEFYYRDKSK